jgi:hypothetical protein
VYNFSFEFSGPFTFEAFCDDIKANIDKIKQFKHHKFVIVVEVKQSKNILQLVRSFRFAGDGFKCNQFIGEDVAFFAGV